MALVPLLAILSDFVPQILHLFGRDQSEVAQRNIAAGQLVANTVIKATGTAGLGEAIDKIASDDAAKKAAQAAVNDAWDDIMELTEVGTGGVDAARKFATAQSADGPWWRFLANGAFWMGLFLSPLIYMVVYKVLWGDSSEQLKTVVVTAIVSGLLGAITGFWFGAAYQHVRQRIQQNAPT
jgi:hypothetical protein